MLSIRYYLLRMAAAALAVALLWGISYPLRAWIRRKNGTSADICRQVALLLLLMFLAGLLILTLTPPAGWDYHEPFQGTVNLVPVRESVRLFRFYLGNKMWTVILINFLGNVVMFIPIGFFAGLLSDRPCWWKAALWAFGLSLFIELAQLFACRGTDVDDLILNTLGGLVGHWLFLAFRRAAPGFVSRCAKRRKGCV